GRAHRGRVRSALVEQSQEGQVVAGVGLERTPGGGDPARGRPRLAVGGLVPGAVGQWAPAPRARPRRGAGAPHRARRAEAPAPPAGPRRSGATAHSGSPRAASLRPCAPRRPPRTGALARVRSPRDLTRSHSRSTGVVPRAGALA